MNYKYTCLLYNGYRHDTDYKDLATATDVLNNRAHQKTKFPPKNSTFYPHKICIVSHSSYHTRRITLVVSHSHTTSGGI